MDECPISCPCRRSGVGAFVLAACAVIAFWWPVFVGSDFGRLVTDLLYAPHHVSPALMVWGAVVILGVWLAVSGIEPALEEGDAARWLPSLVTIAISAVGLWRGWVPPADWGTIWPLAGDGLYISLITAGVTNLCLTAAARAWMVGFLTARGGEGAPRGLPGDVRKWRKIVERQAQEIESLTTEGARAVERAREAEAVLLLPNVKKTVLRALHPDSHPDAAEGDRRLLTERFQRATAVFDRLGVR
jgi:hypothetical protein